MELSIVGLGRMGGGIAKRLLAHGFTLGGYDIDPSIKEAMTAEGINMGDSLTDLVQSCPAPRTMWMMLPSGDPTDQTVEELLHLLTEGDILVDGSNSHYSKAVVNASRFAQRGVEFVDAGTSAGVWGLSEGFCVMAGGGIDAYRRLEPVFTALVPPGGHAHVGPPGAGHFAKMVHNGIEYGLLQAYSEGLSLLSASTYEFDVAAVAEVWRHGSLIRSWLLDLIVRVLDRDAQVSDYLDYVEDLGTGRWTAQEAINLNVPAPVITLSLLARIESRQQSSFSNRLIAAVREEFGGHHARRLTD